MTARKLFKEVHGVLNTVTSNWHCHLVIQHFFKTFGINIHPENLSLGVALYHSTMDYTFIQLALLTGKGDGAKRITTLIKKCKEEKLLTEEQCDTYIKFFDKSETCKKIGNLRGNIFAHSPIKIDKAEYLKKAGLTVRSVNMLINKLYEILNTIASKTGAEVARPENLIDDAVSTAEEMLRTFKSHPVDAHFKESERGLDG